MSSNWILFGTNIGHKLVQADQGYHDQFEYAQVEQDSIKDAQVLNDEEKLKVIMEKYEKGRTLEEYEANRSKRIDMMLEMAGNINYDDYIMALKKSSKRWV